MKTGVCMQAVTSREKKVRQFAGGSDSPLSLNDKAYVISKHRRKDIKIACLALLLLALFPLCSMAQTSVQLMLDRPEAAFGDSVTLRLRVSGAGSLDSPPRIQGLQGFSVSEGGTSSHIEIINFSKSSYTEYIYFIQAKATGTYKIGPAEVRDGSSVFRSNSVTLTVRDVARGGEGEEARAEGPVFLRAELSKKAVYAEEPAIYTVKLYRLVKVSNLSLDIPDNPAFTFKKIGEPLEYVTNINGQPYQVLEVRHEVVPLSKGRFKLPPATMNMAVYEQAGRQRAFPYGDPFFSISAPQQKTVASNPLELNVYPLPSEGRPADFSSLLGRYTMQSGLDKDMISTGDTASFTVTIEGRGNVSRIPDLTVPDIQGVKTYADKPAIQIETDAQGYKGVKTMKWAFVPQKEGTYEIPPLVLTYFDTQAKAYRMIRTPPYTLTVRPGSSGQAAQQAPPGLPPQAAQAGKVKREVEEVGRDILPVHTDLDTLRFSNGTMPDPAVLWLLIVVPPFLYLGGYGAKRWMNPSRKYEEQAKSKGALRHFMRQCSSEQVAAEDLLSASREYFNRRFGSSLGTLTPEEAGAILERQGVAADAKAGCVSLLNELTQRVYTGRGNSPFERKSELVSLMRDIDRPAR